MTRLETLCKLHSQQGGTIHQFNQLYGVDILNLAEHQFECLIRAIRSMKLDETIKYAKDKGYFV